MPWTARLSLAAATWALALPSWSATLYTLPSATPALQTDTEVAVAVAAAAGAGQVDFTLAGYGTLDGDNGYIDVFHLSLNGVEIFSGTWDLGGGGANRLLLDTYGATVGTAANQRLQVSIPVMLAAGENQIVFRYASPATFEGSSRAGFQGLGDEGWGLDGLTVTGTVPEPAESAMLLAGLAVLGWLATRRR